MSNIADQTTHKKRFSTLSIINSPKISRQALIVILISCISLVCIRYLTPFNELTKLLELLRLESVAQMLRDFRSGSQSQQLFDLIYWTLCRILFYLFIPVITILIILKKPLSAFGWKGSGNTKKDIKLFSLFFCFMIPIVYFASTQDSFQIKYPFYRPHNESDIWPNLIIWEFFYFLQFISLEFFFRGFMVHGIKHEVGDYSVLFMVIPYCMIHFQKPFLETIGAIFAGIILGYISLRKGSIYTGIALHFSVAIIMDAFALYHLGFL